MLATEEHPYPLPILPLIMALHLLLYAMFFLVCFPVKFGLLQSGQFILLIQLAKHAREASAAATSRGWALQQCTY